LPTRQVAASDALKYENLTTSPNVIHHHPTALTNINAPNANNVRPTMVIGSRRNT